MAKRPKWVSAEQVLETLELYFELQSSHLVGQKLGIDRHSVLGRLTPLGVIPRPKESLATTSLEDVNDMDFIRALKRYLQRKIEWEKQNPFAVRKSNAVPAIELLSTVALYFQLNSMHKVAEHLNISDHAVESRLKGLNVKLIPVGRRKSRARDFNDMGEIELLMKRLHDEAQVDIYRAQ